jgi:RecQ family ATP-dependent DNA helicase
MSAGSNSLVPGLPLTREEALALPGLRRYRLVEFLVRWEHFGAARELLESLVAQKAGQHFYQYRLAQCYLATGDVERAKEVARALYGSPAARAIGTLAIGDVFYVEGRLARAEEYYRQALEVEKTRESAQRRLAWCLLHRRSLEAAAALAEQLAAGKRPAQLAPAAVRLLAAVASAGGRAEDAGALRRDLRQRWHQELERLRASLVLADDSGVQGREGTSTSTHLDPPTPEGLNAQDHRSADPGTGPEPAARPGTGPELRPPAPRVPAVPSQLPSPERPTGGYAYPTARERRAAAEAAARQEARRSAGGLAAASPPAAAPRQPSPAGPETSAASPDERQQARSSDSPESLTPGSTLSDGNNRVPPAPTGGQPSRTSPNGDAELRRASANPIHAPDLWPTGRDSGALRVALKELFGYEAFRPGQEEVVRHLMEGRSVLATMPTGSGKSLCFQLPAMLLPRATVVISPLIALMQDQIESLPPRVRPRATFLNSSLESMELEQRLRQVAAGQCSLLYAAPERLRQRPFLHALRRAGVSLLVVDEAHCISLWGQDFRPDYLFLPKLLQELGQPPLLAMTATATPAMQNDMREQFRVPLETVSQGVFRPNLFLAVRCCENRQTKLKRLRELCRDEPGAMIVYVNSRVRAEHLSQALNEAGISAGFYHAGLPAELREVTQQQFMRGVLRCLVATVAFGMGVDKPDIRLIVHHDLPRSLEGYYQEAGRAGRDGKPARCVLFASSADKGLLSRWARQDRLSPGDVLTVDGVLRGAAHTLTLSTDDLERETGLDETRLRVAVSVLERVGALRREYDLPRVCTLQVMAQGDAPFGAFIAAARLRLRQRVTRDTEELCAMTGIAPDAIEPCLLDWAERGWLEYRGSARGLRLEPLPVPDLEARVGDLLGAMEMIDEKRLLRLSDYVRTSTCRHRFLSEYFGHLLFFPGGLGSSGRLGRCGECDNCRGAMGAVRR